MKERRKISVVIPCYNSEKMIMEVVNRIKNTLIQREEFEYEIILVNDGSKDNTWDVIKNLAEINSEVKAINFSQNFGQHNAMMAAYRKASGDLILGMDDDGENRPEEMFMLIDKLDEGYDCVCAEYEAHASKFRSLGTKMNNWMAYHMIGKPKDLMMTSYYVVKRFVIDQVIQYENAYPYVAGLFLQASKNWGTVKLERSERLSGTSGYSLKKLLSLWVNGFTAFSVKPLRLAIAVGVFFAVLGFLAALYFIIRRLIGVDVALGYTSIMSWISFFGGMIMILLGIVGEYVGRIYISINNSPQYVIKEEID